MILFTPNTLIKSSEINENFDELKTAITRFVPVEGVTVVNNVDPANTNWTAVDVTAQTSPKTYAVALWLYILSGTTASRSLYLRPTGSSVAQGTTNLAARNQVVGVANFNTYIIGVDASQSFDWSVNNADVSSVYINLIGYWETL